jgi:hypothetical protein
MLTPYAVVMVNEQVGKLEPGLYRHLHSSAVLNRTWLIQIPGFADPVPPGKRRHKSYTKGPIRLPLQDFEAAQAASRVCPAKFIHPTIWNKTDAELVEQHYPKVKDPTHHTMIVGRDERWAWIEGLVTKFSLAEILEGALHCTHVKETKLKLNISEVSLYNALNLYWLSGGIKNSLLGTRWRGGGKGRRHKLSRKVGRENAATARGLKGLAGFVMNQQSVDYLQFGWKWVSRYGVYKAYLLTMGAFWSEAELTSDGSLAIRMLPASQRPTKDQFRYWGPKGAGNNSAAREILGDREWVLNYQGGDGSALDGIAMTHVTGVCDTSSNDTYLTRIDSRLKPCGFVNRLFIYDAATTLIVGLHAGYEAPSTDTFLKAVLNAASSPAEKVLEARRYGVESTESDWCSYTARIYQGDHGEYDSERAREAVSQFGSLVRLIPTGRADLNPIPESGHRRMHRRVDHQLDGTTKGRKRKRGERHPALSACLNFPEYMRELIEAIVWNNTRENIAHRIPIEMRRCMGADTMVITRMDLYRWLVANGYVATTVPDFELLRAHCLPRLYAVMHGNGVFLLRPGIGERKEILGRAHFSAPYLRTSGLLDRAASSGVFPVVVRGDSSKLDRVWLSVDGQGLVPLNNIAPDPHVAAEATLQDCMLMQDDDKFAAFVSKGDAQQEDLEEVEGREQRLAAAREAKAQELAGLRKKPSKKEQLSGIRANREAEIAALRAQQEAQGSRPQPAVDDLDQTPASPRPWSPLNDIRAAMRSKPAEGVTDDPK